MELKFKDLVKEAQEKSSAEPFSIDLGDGKKPIVLNSVPLRLFTSDIDFGNDAGDLPRVAMDLLRRMFPAKDWPRVETALEDAPPRAAGELLVMLFNHFGLTFSDSEAGKESEDSNE